MQIQEQIQKAIEAHADWKRHLDFSITTGRSSYTVANACRDDRCALGQWLYGLEEATKASTRWQCVRSTHADFHKEAANILDLALAGHQRAARACMTYTSAFSGLSNKLTAELTAWKRESIGKLSSPTKSIPAFT